MGAPYLLKVLAAPQFRDAIVFVILGALIEICRVLGNLFGNAVQLTRRTSVLAVPYATGAVVSLGFLFLAGIMDMSIQIGGAALALGASSMLALMWWRMSRQIA